jgi:hypothetical protein
MIHLKYIIIGEAMIGNNLNLILGIITLLIVGVSYLLRKRLKYLPQLILLTIAAILMGGSMFSRSLADFYIGLLALIIAVASSGIVALIIRRSNSKKAKAFFLYCG